MLEIKLQLAFGIAFKQFNIGESPPVSSDVVISKSDKIIDIVVAVRNEVESLPNFISQVRSLHLQDGVKLKFIFVEDSSTDGTKELLSRLHEDCVDISCYFLKEGFGQGVAVAYGIQRSSADAVIMMDVDGGHPVSVIPLLVNEYLSGASIVQAQRNTRDIRAWYRRNGTLFFNFLMRCFCGIDTTKQNVYFRLVNKEVYRSLLSDRRWPYFLRIRYNKNSNWIIKFVEFWDGDRTFGQSKYNVRRLVGLSLLAFFTSVSLRRFYSFVGLLSALTIFAFISSSGWLAFVLVIVLSFLVVPFVYLQKQDPLSRVQAMSKS